MRLEKMTSRQAAGELTKVEKQLGEVKGRIAEIRPPKPAPPAPSGGQQRDWDVLAGAGRDYVDAHERQDVDALGDLRDELDRLSIEEDMLLRRRETLQQRQRAAQAAEEREAAPGIARDASSAFTPAVARVAAAVAELRAAKSEAEELLRTIASARKLAGADSPGLEPEQLAAWWRLGLRDGEAIEIEVEDMPGTLRSHYVTEVSRYVPLPPRAVRLVNEFLGDSRSARANAEELVRRHLVRAIAAGAKLDDDSVARATITELQGRRSPEVRQAATDTWLSSRSRDAVLAP